MNALMLVLILQSSLLLPPRTAVENPATVSPIPQKLRKDYDKLWTRFLSGKEDQKLVKDLDKLHQKQKTFEPAWIMDAYIALYQGNDTAAREKFMQALAVNASNRIALYYLAELADAHGEYARAATLYAQLQTVDSSHPEVETKRQKAFLLATDSLLRVAARAETENRLAEAERAYRQATALAPNEPAFHARLADILTKQNRKDEADAERKLMDSLMPRVAAKPRADDGVRVDDLEDLGRWGSDIELFHKIRDTDVISREQFATLLVRYFPQLTELRQTPQIITDIQNSPARAEIQTVVGIRLMEPMPNHDFYPAVPISRGELATALGRLSRLLDVKLGSASPVSASDVVASNSMYSEIQLVLDNSIMGLENSGSFNVNGQVSGSQAVLSVERVLRIFQQTQR
jgi:tetratricopeptide (TPR) repeat protein